MPVLVLYRHHVCRYVPYTYLGQIPSHRGSNQHVGCHAPSSPDFQIVSDMHPAEVCFCLGRFLVVGSSSGSSSSLVCFLLCFLFHTRPIDQSNVLYVQDTRFRLPHAEERVVFHRHLHLSLDICRHHLRAFLVGEFLSGISKERLGFFWKFAPKERKKTAES